MFIEHINMTITDLNRSISFYEDLLGLKVRWRGKTSSGSNAAHIGDDRFYLALFENPDGGCSSDDYDQIGINHFGFVVQDLAPIKAKLIEMGITPHLEADYDPGTRLYFHDPDGVEVELVAYG